MTEKTTLDAAEVARFAALAEEWWNPSGPLAPLHRLNPLRLSYLKEAICRKFGRDPKDPRALAGLTVLDVGCGGGLVTEPLCRMGATVIGIDPAQENVTVAALHASEAGLAIDYRAITIEAQASRPERFDVVTILEVVEHVSDVPAFVAACASVVKPDGMMIAATINRTMKAWLLAIVGAEYVLRWLPRGSHSYDKLVTPAELTAAFRAAGLTVTGETGVMYVPIADRWRLSRDMDVNYMMVAEHFRSARERPAVIEGPLEGTANAHLRGTIIIDGGEAFPQAVRRLKASFPDIDWRQGDADGKQPAVVLVADKQFVEGAFRIVAETDRAPVVRVSGGGIPGVVYGVEELIKRGGTKSDRLALGTEPITASPSLTYRTFWTWDHSTNWELSQVGQQEIGVFNPYGKPPGGFLADYRRLVDFCSRNRIAAIVIFGFLRDSHGGIEAAQELCHYANERGVRIIPGIAIGAYGGVYWEGDHPYNLATWLRKNPQFAATMEKGVGFQLADLSFPLNFPRSDYTMTACPSAPETMAWMEEAVSWLAETFEIGGINIESGDYGVCGCARCVARRSNPAEANRRVSDTGDSWSQTDMAENFPRLYRAAKAKRPDLWIYCEMQWDNLLDPVANEAQRKLPRGGIYQHTVNKTFWGRLKNELTRGYVEALPTQPNVLRCQFACQWNGDERTERYAFNARTFAELAGMARDVGMEGLTVWGEPSAYHATTELSYLAFARFCYDQSLTWTRFLEDDLAPLLGGRSAADRFVAIAEEIDGHQRLPVTRLAALRAEALSYCAGSDGETARRWLTLGEQIARREYMGA